MRCAVVSYLGFTIPLYAFPTGGADGFILFDINCSVQISYNGGSFTAAGEIINDVSDNNTFTGGSYWNSGSKTTGPEVTEVELASCLGVADGDIVIHSQSGADADKYADEDYLGIYFTALSDGTTVEANTSYHWYVGTPPSGSDQVAPVAVVGGAQTVAAHATVTVNGSSSFDYDGSIESYLWTVYASDDLNTPLDVSDNTSSSFSFVPDAPAVEAADLSYVVYLTVTDDDGLKDVSDAVNITVESEDNVAPTAEISGGNATYYSQDTIVLNGDASSSNNTDQSLTYLWSEVSSYGISISDTTTENIGFTAPSVTTGASIDVQVKLIVDDGFATDEVTKTITVYSKTYGEPNAAMTISPGTQVESGATVTLDASGSTSSPLGGKLSYYWYVYDPDTDYSVADDEAIATTFVAPILGLNDPDLDIFVELEVEEDGFYSYVTKMITVTNNLDAEAPTPIVSAGITQFETTNSFELTVSFDEAVSDFDISDVEISGGSVSGFSGSGPYIMTVTPTGSSDVTVQIPAGAAEDMAGNKSVASNTLTLSIQKTLEEDTGEVVMQELAKSQSNLLAANSQLSMTNQFQSGQPGGSINGSASGNNGQLAFAIALESGAWLELQGVWSDIGGSKSSYVHGAFGAHRYVTDNFMIGGMLQFDETSSDTSGGDDLTLRGWLIGPYLAGKVPDQELYYEARILAGKGTGDAFIASSGNSGSFDFNRLIAMGKLQGAYQVESLTYQPFVSFVYAQTNSESYVDSGSLTIAAQTADALQGELGLTARFPSEDRRTTFSLGASGVAGDENGQRQDSRAKLTFGVFHTFGDAYLSFDSFYDGIGRSDFESIGATVRYQWDF